MSLVSFHPFCRLYLRIVEPFDGIFDNYTVTESFSTKALSLHSWYFRWFFVGFSTNIIIISKRMYIKRIDSPYNLSFLWQECTVYNRIIFIPELDGLKIKQGTKNLRSFFIQSLNGMALGLFSSLIIGLIIKQIGDYAQIDLITRFGRFAQLLMGPAIGAGVAYALKGSPLAIFASLVTGAIGAGSFAVGATGNVSVAIGEPVGAYVAAVTGILLARSVSGKTKVDIILVPAVVIFSGGMVGIWVAPVISSMMKAIGAMINWATELQPIPMGMILSVAMGMILTAPISSAALAISLNLQGLAAGASTIGCCCQMVGFAVASFRENGIGGFIAQGLGTSMLQIPNIVKNPKIWVPPILSSAILGPIGIALFNMENNSIGAGMGTSGLVGPLATFTVMLEKEDLWSVAMKVLLFQGVFPMILTYLFTVWMRKTGWIKAGDMKLSL